MKSVLIDSRAPKKAKERLASLGYNVIALPPSRYLPGAISGHADSLIFRLENQIITFADYCDEAAYVFSDIREAHPSVSVGFSSETPSHVYPDDAKYNALVMGNKVFARLDSISATVKEAAIAGGYELINVNQGYPACTTLVLDGTHAITSDKGLFKVLTTHGVSVTLIEVGSIGLPPYEYGFIGGTAGVCDGKVYFVGDYTAHPSAADIDKTIRSLSLNPVSLTEGLLTDIGGLLFLNNT